MPDLHRSGETYCFTSFPRAGTCASVGSEVGNLGDNILPEAKEILLLDICRVPKEMTLIHSEPKVHLLLADLHPQ